MTSFRPLLPVLFLVLVVSASAEGADSLLVHCRVFHDLDANGIEDPTDPGLAGVRITNGEGIPTTDAGGRADLTVDLDVYRFVTLTVPAGYWPTTDWFRRFESGQAAPDTVVFGLQTFPATAADPIRWVHITDTQTQTWGHPIEIVSDLQSINELVDPPLFLVNTGDLVETGSDTTHWENYVDQLGASDFPVFPVVGNHDILGMNPPLENYERYMGPPYYDFVAGSWRFVIYNNENPGVGTPAQDLWLDELFDAAVPGESIVILQHRMLAQISPSVADYWYSRGVVATFTGHWHALQFSKHTSGILDFNLSRTAAGPLDRTPRSFGVVTMRADGEIDYELRRIDVDHRVEITYPQPGQVLAEDQLEVLVQAYDTSSPVTSLTASASGAGGRATLTREGISLWRGVLDVSGLPEGGVDVTVSGSFDDGHPVLITTGFQRGAATQITTMAGEDWPMFRKSPAGSSYTATPLAPPLELAWTTAVPGMVALSSPVVADGRVFLGTRSETGDPASEAVTCCDAVTGSVLWSTPVPGGVALAPAVAGNVVIASSMADSAFGLDASTGLRLWAIQTPGNRYKLAAPIVSGGTAWVGSEPRLLQIQAATGSVDWTSPLLGSSWYPGVYSAPAVTSQYVYTGFYGITTPPDGLSILHRAAGVPMYQENAVHRSPTCAGDTVYVIRGTAGLGGQFLGARDALGQNLWTSLTDIGRSTASPALARGVLVVAGLNGNVHGFRASDGADLWTHAVDLSLYDMSPNRRNQRDTNGTAAIADDVAYVGSLDGNLYALDLATGSELWRWYLGTPIGSSPAVSGNMLFVGASDGHLYGFTSGDVPSDSPAPTAGRASVFTFYPPQPNPSRASVHFEWVQPHRGRVRIDVFDVAGRRVAMVLDESRDAGESFATWNGRDDRGGAVAAGVYFVRLRAGDASSVRKLVRLRR